MENQAKKPNKARRIGKIVLKIILGIFFLILLIFILILTPPVQSFIRKKAVAFLEKKLDTKIVVGSLRAGLTKDVVLSNVYIEDRQKDTLLYGGSIRANLNLLRLIFKNEMNIRSIELDNITAKIKRQLPDTSFNFQFIIDAFAPPPDTIKTTPDTTATAATVNIGTVELNRINIIYKDVITGSDMEARLEHLDTKIEKFDPEKLHFDIGALNIEGLTANVYQFKPLATREPAAKDMAEAKEPLPLQLDFNKVDLSNVKLDYRNDVSAMYADIDIGGLTIRPKTFDLTNRVMEFGDIALNKTTATIRLGKKEQAKIVEKEVEQEVKSQVEAGWKVYVASIDLTNNNFQFDNDNSPKLQTGMDYAHLKADSITLKADEVVLTKDSIAGKITKATFREKSGFVLNELQTDFLYAGSESHLENLYLQTPGTELKRSVKIRYSSIQSLQSDIGNIFLDLDIDKSKVLVKDVLTFAPMLKQQPAFANPNATWYIDSRITGRVADLRIDQLQVSGLQDTKIDITGRISGLPTMKNIAADLHIRNISSSRRDVKSFIPNNTIPSNIVLPATFTATGDVNGNSGKLNTDLFFATDLGNASVKGSFSDFSDPKLMSYNANVETWSIDLGTILQQKQMLGPVSATITAKGKGVDLKTANASFDGIIHSAVVKQYNYRNLELKGNIANQKATIDAGMVDPNIHFALNTIADFSDKYPAVRINGMIDSIKLQPLHLTPDAMIFRGKIDADFPVTNPDDLHGKLFLTQALLVQDEKRLPLDTVQLLAGRSDTGHYVQLSSDIMTAKLEGQYKLTELGYVFQQAIQPYFAVMPAATIKKLQPYDFTLNAYVMDNPALKLFVPNLERMDSVSFTSHFSDQNSWTAYLKAPSLDIGSNKLRNLELRAGTNQNTIELASTIEKITSGANLELDNTTLNAAIANNTIDFNLNIKDKEARSKYNIKGLLQHPRQQHYQFALNPDSLILNYDKWGIATNNRLLITPQGFNASNFVLSKNGQQLSINSLSAAVNAPMEVNFSQFRLATLTGFVQTDSTFANGILNGKITFNELSNEPVFVGNLTVNDFSLRGDTVGNVNIAVNNRVANTYAADIKLSGRGNDARFVGNYYLKPGESNFDFDLDINALPMATAQAFSNDMISNASGSLNGHFDVTGTMKRPIVKGDLNFNKTAFNYKMLNSYFTIDQEKIIVNENGLQFYRFEIKDSAQNSLIINGNAFTSNFVNYRFDMRLRANNFRAINSTKRDNKLFYGQIYFNTNLNISGTEAAPVVDGRLVINEGTKFTVVLPQQEPGIVDREGVVEFVDFDAPLNDSLFMAAYDSLNTTPFTGMDVSVNIEVSKEAEFNLIIDEGNGDFLNVKGEALLTAGIDPSGKINLAGSYELEQGSYELSFNFIRRKFAIEKGSRIVWQGEPTDATVNIEAIYVANAAPLDLVKNQLEQASAFTRNTYLQKLPFDVHLGMEGDLLKPQIRFDIVLPEEKKYAVSGEIITTVRTKLDQLRQEEGEMNKQVFSLLLLNRFIAENPFESSTNFSAGAFARQSVSKLLTEQLNRLAGGLVAGVDLNFDVLSSEDYTTGERRDRTDLNVGLSKRLLNDRLKVSVGSNFELEGPRNSNQQSNNIAGDVALDYSISRDNRYMLRAYRKNEYQGVIDGYIIETGMAFIITVDYNNFREIFLSKRERDKRRQQRQQQRELERQQQQQAAADSLRTTD